VVISRWNLQNEPKLQAGWAALSVALYVVTLLVVRRSRDLDRYRYILLLLAAFLMLAPLIPHLGEDINGARLWVRAGSFSFQPVEIAKILLCVFFASYFAENKELLSIPTARVGNRLVIDPRPLIPILLAWGFAMLVIGAENDIGFALLIFILFIGLLWIATGRFAYLVLGLALFGVGAYLAAHLFTQFHERVSIWLDPGPRRRRLAINWSRAGTRSARAASAGWGSPRHRRADRARGHLGHDLRLHRGGARPARHQRGCARLPAARRRRAQRRPKGPHGLRQADSDGTHHHHGFQAFFIMAGVLRLLPLTGITLPFMAYGGSSLVANYVLIAILLRIRTRGPPPRPNRSPASPSRAIASSPLRPDLRGR